MQQSGIIAEMRASIEADLRTSLQPLRGEVASPIADMVAHHMGWDLPDPEGKRIRPTFTLLCCGAVSGQWQKAIPAASAIEWIHNFSLIHDDIQDQSATRRGRETVWTRNGVPQAINVGDAVYALARLTTHRLLDQGISPVTLQQIQAMLDRACLDLTIGQYLDMDFETRTIVRSDEYMLMIANKTGALLHATCAIGAVIGGANEAQVALYGEFGRNVGLAFQMYDDLLGIWGDTKATGKPAGDDIRSRKKTLPVLYGFESSERVRTLWGDLLPGDDEQIPGMIQALEDAGADRYVLDRATHFTQKALSSLQQAQPLQPYADQLETLTLQLLKRKQ